MACGPGSLELSKSCMDMASKLFTSTFTLTCSWWRPDACEGKLKHNIYANTHIAMFLNKFYLCTAGDKGVLLHGLPNLGKRAIGKCCILSHKGPYGVRGNSMKEP